ncbi:MAG: septum formation initiator family protein [Akkermansiaceae bacterium]|nr:septum formation initiator family protein [Akkermansiaceae bacterium]
MPRKRKALTERAPEFSVEPTRRELFGKPTLCVFWLFVVAVCTALLIPALPQYRLLKEIEAELADAKMNEETLRQERHKLEAEAEALKQNPRYLEARARDPLRYQVEGETVIQMED